MTDRYASKTVRVSVRVRERVRVYSLPVAHSPKLLPLTKIF